MAVSRFGDRYHTRVPSFDSSNTAYNGADGFSIHDDDTFNDDSFSTKTPKTALSTRLLSSLPTQPVAAAALNRSRSILHSKAKSLAAWTSSFNTPIPEKTPTANNRLFGDLFSGESAPVRLGIPSSSPIKEDSEFIMDYRPSLTQRPSIGSRRKSVMSTHTTSPPKQSWFARKSVGQAAPAPATLANDELLTLNIHNSLFPNGPADSLSPSDFNDLLLNATTLLERMQVAYREKVEYIASIQPEIDTQREECEEAETRAQHLKMQLEDMARKAQEQEQVMSEMATQLADERLRTRGLHEELTRSIRVVDDDNTPRRHKRGSAGSASDSGFESDWDRDTESVVSSGIPTPRTPPAIFAAAPSPFDNLDQRLHDRRLKLQRQAPLRAINLGHGNKTTDDNAAAWSTVQQLRCENQDLYRQMESMQQTLQGCIDYVNTVHI